MALGMSADKYRTVNLGIYLDQWIEMPAIYVDTRSASRTESSGSASMILKLWRCSTNTTLRWTSDLIFHRGARRNFIA